MIHEALLYEWPLLQDWLREDHDYLSWYRPFQEQAERWKRLRTQASEELAIEALLREANWSLRRIGILSVGLDGRRMNAFFSMLASNILNKRKSSKSLPAG